MAAAWIWLVGAAVYLVCEAVAAASVPGYSYIADYISDLGVSAVMNVGAFMVHGSLLLLGAVIFVRACPTPGWAGWSFVLAAAVNAIGNVFVGTFRSGRCAHPPRPSSVGKQIDVRCRRRDATRSGGSFADPGDDERHPGRLVVQVEPLLVQTAVRPSRSP